jgi:phosphatidylglycerol lysyltransferase
MSQQILRSAKPLIVDVASDTSSPGRFELESLVRRFGFNSTSYVLLEGPKLFFKSERVEGFIAYQLSAGVAVIGGDPVCAPGDAELLLSDFLKEMKNRRVCAYQVSPEVLEAFRANGFGDIQIGKEAVFDLKHFTLSGGRMEVVRAATNKARREGVIVEEHFPFAPGAEDINRELCAISHEWLRQKGSCEMGFLLGGLGLEVRSEKRYFIARSGDGLGRVEGFIVCEPVFARQGYYLDITRRRTDAVRGSMELLTTEIFRLLGEEGSLMASMGLAPLANLEDADFTKHPRLARLMRFVYERKDMGYDFKQLYRYKAKYHPHAWESRYLCFRPAVGPRVLYATLRVRDAFSLVGAVNSQWCALKSKNRSMLRTAWSNLKSWKTAAFLVLGYLGFFLFR